jgi:hypothetical protein
MRWAVLTLSCLALFAGAASASSPVPEDLVEIQNRRAYEVWFEYSVYPTEELARSSEHDELIRWRAYLERMRVLPGKAWRIPMWSPRPWVRWCQLEPASNLPCEIVDLRVQRLKVTLE